MSGKKINFSVIARALARSNPHQCWRLLRRCFATPRNDVLLFLLSSFLLFSCSTSTPPVTPQLVTIYSPSAAQPWLSDLYNCAAQLNNVVLSRIDDSASAEIVLRVGEPRVLTSPAYQIDEENITVIMNTARPPKVELQQIKGLFTGQITHWNQIASGWGKVHSDQSGEVHVWVFSADEDVQQVFNKMILGGRPVVSSASVAVTPQQMINMIQSDRSAIGILSQSWNDNHEVFEQAVIATVPVLAVTQTEPQGVIKELIGCLQSK
jgi:hypothetical protein